MFTIDLLKGKCIPRKSSPGSIATAATAAFVPVVIVIMMFSLYLRNKIIISVQANSISNFETKIEELSDAIKLQKSFELEIGTYNNCLSEVSNSLERHIQWSPVLVTLVENMPDSVMLTAIDIKQRSIRIKVPQNDDPTKMIDVSVPAKTLEMKVVGKPQSNSDEAVKNFSDLLRSSSTLGPKLETIRISQGLDSIGGKELVSYQIECIFKPEL
jgi:Tfp pilus assembly protein PilN